MGQGWVVMKGRITVARFLKTEEQLQLRMRRARPGCREFYSHLLEKNERRLDLELRKAALKK